MLKLLYKPTGNIFTLPDEEAMNIKKNDRGNDYAIIEAGLQEQKEEKITEEEVKAIEEAQEKKIEEIEQADKEAEEKERIKEEKAKINKAYVKYDASDLTKLPKKDLVLIAEKLGMRDMDNKTKEEVIDYIEGNKKKVIKKPGSGRTRKVK